MECHELEAAVAQLNGDLATIEHRCDFRCWLVSRGRAVYQATLRDPESLRPHVTDEESMHWQSLGYVGRGVYEQLTGDECPYRPERP